MPAQKEYITIFTQKIYEEKQKANDEEVMTKALNFEENDKKEEKKMVVVER